MARIVEIEGCPVLLRARDVDPTRAVRFRPKKRKKTYDYGIKKLNERQRKTLSGIMEAGKIDAATKRAAAEAAGYAPSHAIERANNVLRRRPIVERLEKHGVTDDKLAGLIAKGLDANHPLADGDKPDWHARHKFVQEANKLKDNYPATKVKQEMEGRVVHLHLTMDDAAAADKFRKMRGVVDVEELTDAQA